MSVAEASLIPVDANERRPELVLHFREGCHLCEDMQQQLAELFEPDEFTLTLVDIDEDENLRLAYNVRVPVLSLVPLQTRLARWQCSLTGSPADDLAGVSGAVDARHEENRVEIETLEELCEHFLDLVAVREALASYNTSLLAACPVPADR